MDLAYKAGSYVICSSDCTHIQEYLSISGWAKVPFCSPSGSTSNEYVFGLFINGATDDSWFNGKNTQADSTFNGARSELLREQVRAGLQSCYGANAVMINPPPGSVLTGRSTTFTWSAGTGAAGYSLDVGSTLGGSDYASLQLTATTATVNNLPCDGRPLFVRLSKRSASVAAPIDYSYTACTNVLSGIVSPPPGVNLASSTVTFSWNGTAGADGYRLDVGNRPGASDIASVNSLETSAAVNNIPTDGRNIYARLYTRINGALQPPNDYVYTDLASPAPSISAVVNAASLQPALSPGCLAILSGGSFGSDVSVTMGNTRATMVGNPTASQLTFLIPAGLSPGPFNVTVTSGGNTSAPFPAVLQQTSPGLYGLLEDDTGLPIPAGQAVARGAVIGVRAVGMGPVDSGGKPTLPFRVLFGATREPAAVIFAGQTANSPGVVLIRFAVPTDAGGDSQPVALESGSAVSNTIRLTVRGPVINAIVNGASFAPGARIAPGSLVSLFGTDISAGDKLGLYPSTTLPAGGAVTFNGILAPLFDALGSRGQINLLAPFELPTSGLVQVTLTNTFGAASYSLPMAATAPGFFRLADPSNSRRANVAALIANTAWRVIPSSMAAALGIPQNCAANRISTAAICGQPAAPGDTIQIYTTGLGAVSAAGRTLRTGDVPPADGSVLYRTVETPRVTIGGRDASVGFAGLAPGFAGLYQVNVVVPAGITAGDDVPVVISIGGASDQATIAIRNP
jgi:uncharacterized protein (TIGR03437 family)